MRRPNFDWSFAKALFIQGLTLQEIADKLGRNVLSVKSACQRQEWSEQKRKALEIAHSVAAQPSKKTEVAHLRSISAEVKDLLSEDVRETAKTLRKVRQTRKLTSVKLRADTADKLTDTASKLFGWDVDASKRSPINIAILNSSRRDAPALPAGAHVVELPATTEPEPSEPSVDPS